MSAKKAGIYASSKSKNPPVSGRTQRNKKKKSQTSGKKKQLNDILADSKGAPKKAKPEANSKMPSKAKKTVKSSKTPRPSKAARASKPSKASKAPKASNKSAENIKEIKSETLRSYERQKKLEDTMPLGSTISQLTSDLPILGKNLDAPDRRPWKKLKLPKLKLDVTGKRLLIAVGLLVIILALAILIVARVFTVDTVTIEGNTHYTNEEIYDMVLGDRWGHNSLYLSMKYKNKDIEGIPFIQTMNVHIVDPSTIKITVYEKAMAGFVEYMGRYFYFDKDGTVVESSDKRTTGIPQVMGLKFDHIILYEKLPVESDEIFKQILEITQLLAKYDVEMDKVYFDSNYNMTLYFDEARIKVGGFDNIDEKIIRLKDILPELKGKKGVLRLDNYSGKDSIITFEVDN